MPTVSRKILIGAKIKIGGRGPFFLIAGPCVIESGEHALKLAREASRVCESLGIPFIFKASFDKANRSSLKSYRGPGLEKGLDVLGGIKKELGIAVLSDVHETRQMDKAGAVLDVIQIPALLCRQTDLLLAAAKTGKPVNVKKGQFMAPEDMKNIVEKITSVGNRNIILTERGTTFGYHNLVFDIRSIPLLKSFGYPVVIDASHIVQKPGGEGTFSGGDPDFIPLMARTGVCAGADGVFLEIHDHPSEALSDAFNSFNISSLKSLLESLLRVREAVGKKS